MEFEELQRKVDENTNKINNNLEKIIANSEKIIENERKIQENTMALDILGDFKRESKRIFTIWIITFIAFIGLLGYTIWLLNDISNVETTTSQEIHDLESIENSDIINGDYYGND